MKLTHFLRAGLDPVALAQQTGMNPDPWQVGVLRSTTKRLLLLCARQTGKSSTAAVLAIHTALFQPSSLVLLLSPSMRQSQELFRKCLAVYRAVGRPVEAEAMNTMSLVLETGSRVISLPGGEGTIRGFSGVSLLLVDEASRVADETYYSARPMVATSGGRIVLMSTPAGRRGFFYEAATHEKQWEKVTVKATDCPRLSADFLREERDVMGDWTYSQEYECRFVDEASQLFSQELIEAALTDEYQPLDLRGGS